MPAINKKSCSRVLASMERTPWAIRPEMLETLLVIAQRQYSEPELVASLQGDYNAGGLDEEPDKVAVINICGPIFPRADFFSEISGACSLTSLERQIDDALYDDAVEAIVLRIDSPGGQVTGIHELAHYIREATEIKPLVAYVSGMACSAAYWLCSAADHIFVDRTSIIGSLGVVAAWTDDSKARTAAGLVDYEVVSSQSPNKRLSPSSEEGRSALQHELDGLADIFLSDVAAFRGVSVDVVAADFGQGGTMLADGAIKVGMVDEASSLKAVINLLIADAQVLPLTNNLTGVDMGLYKSAAERRADRQTRTTTKTKPKASVSRRASKKAEEEELDENGDPIVKPDAEDEFDENGDPIVKPDAEEEFDENGDPIVKPDAEDELDDDDVKEPIEDEIDPDAEEEDEESETKATNKAIKAFARGNKRLYTAIIRRGARRERRRIAAIDELEIVGQANLIKSAKYKCPMTAAATALAVVRAEGRQRSAYAQAYKEDAQFDIKPSSGGAVSSAKNQDGLTPAEAKAIEQIKLGANVSKRETK
ncbi:S49 family peptidase [Budviciaceae bacterium CWB-B4]|uniref:S49 family peptidase n=1 Tax=Limnobaculum xujianqingii TaxID=2738837 RepID=A0A9D7AIH4_9GAMM|nr:S49 family peptidase [Limnobaculum xujianqingii]MBK5073235.1 S49 family peptidase [Limnobaculum xujianqingii]MBK5176544.1 S49 family peptidase [Limnobaculum xujianqingii]